MSVNLNPGLFAQNFQVKNNSVKRAPAAGLTTPLAGDRVDFSFKKAQNKVGFGVKLPSVHEAEEFVPAFLLLVRDSTLRGQSIAISVINTLNPKKIPPETANKAYLALKELTPLTPAAREAKKVFRTASAVQ